MGSAVRITGSWSGQYVYGDLYEGLSGKNVPFEMSLSESWLRRVTGYVRDDAHRGGMPERGRIKGRRKGERLEFVKVMPTSYVFKDGVMREVREILEQDMQYEFVHDPPPHRILYRGVVDDDGSAISGDWLILPWEVHTTDGILRSRPRGAGTWTARRTSSEVSTI